MWQILLSEVMAQEPQGVASATQAAAQQPSPLASLVPFALIFVVFYFLLIRPQKKRMQEEQTLLGSLGKGDEVYTKSGLIGIIAGLTDKVVTLEVSDGVKVKVLRGQIGGLYQKLFEKPSTPTPQVLPADPKNANANKKK